MSAEPSLKVQHQVKQLRRSLRRLRRALPPLVSAVAEMNETLRRDVARLEYVTRSQRARVYYDEFGHWPEDASAEDS